MTYTEDAGVSSPVVELAEELDSTPLWQITKARALNNRIWS